MIAKEFVKCKFLKHKLPALDLIEEIEIEKFKDEDDPDMPDTLKNAFRLFLVESALLCYDFENISRKRKNTGLLSKISIHSELLLAKNFIVITSGCSKAASGLRLRLGTTILMIVIMPFTLRI